MANPKLIVDIYADASKVAGGLDEASNQFGQFGGMLNSLVAPAAAVLGAVTLIGAGALMASDDAKAAFDVMTTAVGEAAAAVGDELLPVIQPLIDFLTDMAGWVEENAAVIAPLIVVIGTLAGAILVINGVMTAWVAVQTALNIAMTANPIGIIIVAIAALVAAFIWLWNNVEGFRNFFIGAWEAILHAINVVIDAVKTAIDWIGKIHIDFPQLPAMSSASAAQSPAMTSAFAASSLAVNAATSAAGRAAAAATIRARQRQAEGSGNTTITVNGALDPANVARQISAILRGRDSRLGLVQAAGVRT